MNSPHDPMFALLQHAGAMAARNDLAGLRRMLDGIPADNELKASTLVEASYAQSLGGHYRNARTAALMAFTLAPKNAEVRRDLVARLRTTNDAALVLELIRASGPPKAIPIPLLLGYAAQLSYLNLQERALEYLDEAWRADPNYPPTLVSRGQVLSYLGRMDEARTDFERCIRIAPGLGQAHWFLAHVTKARAESNHVQRLAAQLERTGLPPRELAALAYALHKELDDLGQHERAWQALEQACSIQRATLRYTTSESRLLVDALIGLPEPSTAVLESSQDPGPPAPIFIVGMHRSGTTLLEQLIDANPGVCGIGELYDFTCAMRYATDHHCRGVLDQTIVERSTAAEFSEVGRRYLEGVVWRLDGKRTFTDKLPSNFLNIDFICRALPHARILHLVRDPLETCFSNLRELFSDVNAWSYDQRELADYFIQYRRLMAHWHARWPGRILDVPYADLIRDTEAVMRRVAAFCELDYLPTMNDPRNSTRAVATASAVQVREGVVRRQTPKWLPYRHHLRPLIEALRQGGVELPPQALTAP